MIESTAERKVAQTQSFFTLEINLANTIKDKMIAETATQRE